MSDEVSATLALTAAAGLSPPLILMGASTGGVEALRRVCAALPADLEAAVLVVLHIDAHPSILPQILSRAGPLPASHALHGELLLPGKILVAPPDCHLLVEDGRVLLDRGPKEHHARPAIDPLFRSASAGGGARVAAVVLTGDLGDGTLGLGLVREAGGLTIVQDPAEAVSPMMPQHAVLSGVVSEVLPLDRIAARLASWCTSLPPPEARPAAHVTALTAASYPDADAHDADRTVFVCPSCKGSLRRSRTPPEVFSCYVGHRFTLESLAAAQNESTDDALWSAYRALCEKTFLLKLLAEDAHKAGESDEGTRFEQRTADTERLAASVLTIARRAVGTLAS